MLEAVVRNYNIEASVTEGKRCRIRLDSDGVHVLWSRIEVESNHESLQARIRDEASGPRTEVEDALARSKTGENLVHSKGRGTLSTTICPPCR